MPTVNQMRQAMIICQYLSNFYRPIYLFRYDVDREEIFIIAGEQESQGYFILDLDNEFTRFQL